MTEQPASPPAAAARSLARHPFALLGLLLAVALAYAGTTQVPFFFDDRPGIERNESIRHLWPLTVPLRPPVTAAGAEGRPFTNLTLAVNYAFGGLSPAGYHVTNVALHAAAALLLAAVVAGTLRRSAVMRHNANAIGLATALLWAVHPLATETVVGVIQRNELLASLFLLAAMYGFMRHATAATQARAWAGVSFLACLCGMASKETMVGAPLILLLYDRAFVAGSFGAAWRSRWRYYLGLASTWLLLAALVASNRQRAGTVGFGLGTSPWEYLLTQCRALTLYVRLALWPHPLVLDYGFEVATRLANVWPQALLILALIGATLAGLWRNRPWAFVAAAFFIWLAPSSSFVPLTTQTIAEHRMYLPLAAVITAAVVAANRLGRRGLVPLTFFAAIPLAALTACRVGTYRSEESIWQDTLANRPGNARAWSSLGHVRVGQDRWEDAARLYAKALELRPDYADTQNDYANVLLHLGQARAALDHYAAAARLKPEDPDIQVNYADALAAAGDLDAAVARLERVLQRHPHDVRALDSLGDALRRLNRPAEALTAFRTALARDDTAMAHNNVGVALLNLGRYPDAAEQFEAALRSGDSALIRHNLSLALDGAGQIEAAMAQDRLALQLDPSLTRARTHLADLTARRANVR